MKLSFSLVSSPAVVFQQLSDPEKFVAVHPVIYKMEWISDNEYKVFEKVKLGFIPYSFTYTARINSDPGTHHVHMEAIVQGHTRIDMKFNIMPGNHGTLVEEYILIESPLPIRSFMEKFIRRQHNVMFENIDALERKV